MSLQSVNVNFIAVGSENMDRIWMSLVTTSVGNLF
jgi:hypothetical protein